MTNRSSGTGVSAKRGEVVGWLAGWLIPRQAGRTSSDRQLGWSGGSGSGSGLSRVTKLIHGSGGKREGKRGRVVVVVAVGGVVVGVAVDGNNSVDDATGYFGVNPLSL